MTQPLGTYEMIKALPGKGTDWPGLVAALSAHYIRVYAETTNGREPWPPQEHDPLFAPKGIRELRYAAMCWANYAVFQAAQRSSFLPPSDETKAWGGFLGGETLVWTDKDAEEKAIAEVAAIVAQWGSK